MTAIEASRGESPLWNRDQSRAVEAKLNQFGMFASESKSTALGVKEILTGLEHDEAGIAEVGDAFGLGLGEEPAAAEGVAFHGGLVIGAFRIQVNERAGDLLGNDGVKLLDGHPLPGRQPAFQVNAVRLVRPLGREVLVAGGIAPVQHEIGADAGDDEFLVERSEPDHDECGEQDRHDDAPRRDAGGELGQ